MAAMEKYTCLQYKITAMKSFIVQVPWAVFTKLHFISNFILGWKGLQGTNTQHILPIHKLKEKMKCCEYDTLCQFCTTSFLRL